MNPQKGPSSPPEGNSFQNTNPAGMPANAGLPPLGQEADGTEMPTAPVAGQTIEPQQPAAPAPDGTPAASQTPARSMPLGQAKPRKRRLLAGLVIAAVVLLLSGGAAAAYFGYYVPNQPDNVLKRALANTLDTSKTKTVQFSGSVKMDVKDSNANISGTVNGTASMESGAYDVTSEIDALVTKLTVDIRSTDGKTVYLKVGGLGGLSALLGGVEGLQSNPVAAQMFASYIDVLNNQWLEINQSMISQITGGNVSGQKLTDTDRQKLADIYAQHPFLTVKQKLADQTIKGANSYHYKIGIDKIQLKDFYAAVKNAGIKGLKLTDDQLASLNREIDKANVGALGFELWVSKNDKMIRQIAFGYEQDGSKLTVSLTVDSYNKDVTVEKPANTKSLLDLLGGLFGGGTPQSSGLTLPALEQDISPGISL